MEKHPQILNFLIEKIENYGKSNIELFRLKSIKKVANIVSMVYANIVFTIILMFMLLLLNIGLSIWVGNLCGEIYLGFLFVAAAYGLLAFLFVLFGLRMMKSKIESKIISTLIN